MGSNKVDGNLIYRDLCQSPSGSSTRFSLIIPAYNEQGYLPVLLDSVDIAKANFKDGINSIEIIVSDNGSTDNTAEIAQSRGCRIVHEEKRIIAAVRNAGAAVANGEILCFVDADSQIHPNTFNAIENAISSGKVVAGSTGVKLDRMSPGIALTYYGFMLPMILITGMDTGVVFCRREDFREIGGYNEQRLFGEDVDFLVRLKLLGRTRKQKLTRLTSVRAIASMRKFEQHGGNGIISHFWLEASTQCSFHQSASKNLPKSTGTTTDVPEIVLISR